MEVGITPPPKKCSVCEKDLSESQAKWIFTDHEGKKEIFCSDECFFKSNEKDNSPQPSPEPQNNSKGMSTETKIILGVSIIFLILIIGLGAQICKRSRKKTS
jgi:hypothetical protein